MVVRCSPDWISKMESYRVASETDGEMKKECWQGEKNKYATDLPSSSGFLKMATTIPFNQAKRMTKKPRIIMR